MNRKDFQDMAKIRRREAKKLLDDGQYSGAYYLSGYMVECALKACIAKQTRKFDFPDKNRTIESYTHDLEKLIRTAGLRPKLENEMKNNSRFKVYWSVLKDWNESSRYDESSKKGATDLYKAITARRDGVLKWIKQYW